MSASSLSNSFVLNVNGLLFTRVMLQKGANLSKGKHCSTASKQTRNDYNLNQSLTLSRSPLTAPMWNHFTITTSADEGLFSLLNRFQNINHLGSDSQIAGEVGLIEKDSCHTGRRAVLWCLWTLGECWLFSQVVSWWESTICGRKKHDSRSANGMEIPILRTSFTHLFYLH